MTSPPPRPTDLDVTYSKCCTPETKKVTIAERVAAFYGVSLKTVWSWLQEAGYTRRYTPRSSK